MLHAMASSQEQEIFMPPWQRSNFSEQRGTMTQLGPVIVPVVGPIIGAPTDGIPMPVIPTAPRSIIIVLDIGKLLS
jgi:hypothetical protein